MSQFARDNDVILGLVILGVVLFVVVLWLFASEVTSVFPPNATD